MIKKVARKKGEKRTNQNTWDVSTNLSDRPYLNPNWHKLQQQIIRQLWTCEWGLDIWYWGITLMFLRNTQENIYRWNAMSGICSIWNDMSGIPGQRGVAGMQMKQDGHTLITVEAGWWYMWFYFSICYEAY